MSAPSRSRIPALLVLALVVPVLAGCLAGPDPGPAAGGLSDGAGDGPDGPPGPVPADITGMEHVARVPGVDGASGLWVHDGLAYVSGYNSQTFSVVDLSDPAEPVLLGAIDDIYTRDAAYLEVDGSAYVLSSADGQGLHVIDVTDPSDPTVVTTVDINSHNVAVLPDTTLAYNSNSLGKGATNAILDLADPANPEVVATFGEYGCHDVEFYQGPDKARLYCPGVDATEIWDIADPLSPELVVRITNPLISAPGAIPGRPDLLAGPLDNLGPGAHHWATTARNGTLLIVGDEFTGAIAPGCGVHAEAQGTSASDPLGALWFYDVTDETDPELEGWFKMTVPADNVWNQEWVYPSCTAHFGQVVEGRDVVVTGWMHAGTTVVDFADPANPSLVSAWNDEGVPWDARLWGPYVVTGDATRGTDILELV